MTRFFPFGFLSLPVGTTPKGHFCRDDELGSNSNGKETQNRIIIQTNQMNGDASATNHRDAAAQELEDAKMHPALESGSEEEDDDDDDGDDSDDSDSGSASASNDDSDDEDDDEEEEEEASSPKPKPKPKKKESKPKLKPKTKKSKKKEKESKDKKRKKQVKGKDAESDKDKEAKKKKNKVKASETGPRKPHRFKPGVSARRLAQKLYTDQAKHPNKAEFLGQSEPFVRLLARIRGNDEEKRMVRMTRGSVQSLRAVYENNIEILVAAAGDICRLTGQSKLSVRHLNAAVSMFQRHRNMVSVAAYVNLPELRTAADLLEKLKSLGGTLEEVNRKTSRAMDIRSRIISRIRCVLLSKSTEELRAIAGELNSKVTKSHRAWLEAAFARLVYVGDTSTSSAVDIDAAKVQLQQAKAVTKPRPLPAPSSNAEAEAGQA